VRSYIPDLEADKGGRSAMSNAEARVVELAAASRLCWALALAGKDLQAAARFVNTERQCLEALGLQRRARPAPSALALLRGESAGDDDAA
jgi:hypothetical protein